jgi:glycosyltransferase involved in cell wall biosynthesis
MNNKKSKESIKSLQELGTTTLAPDQAPPDRYSREPEIDAEDFGPQQPPAIPSGSSLRIAHLGKFFHPSHGGIEVSVRSLAQAQAKLGCTVRVICMDHERGGATRIERDGAVEVVRLRRAASFCKIDYCPDLPRLIRDSEADLLHLHTPNPSMILGLMLSGDRRPLVISHHSDVVKQRLRRLLFKPVERAVYDRARLVLAMSPPYIAGSAVLRRCGDRLGVLPIGLDLAPYLHPSSEIEAKAALLRRSIPGPLWFSCGRLVYYKGFETAMHALRSVPGTWVIVGDGPLRTRLERLAARLNVQDRVRFAGKLLGEEELVAHYLAADAFWFPSNARSEAYGLVQVEAMASGCPVINTAIPNSGVPWVSRHEESGLTVPVNDPASFSAAARRLLEEPGLRDRLAAGGRTRAVAEFDRETMGRRSMMLYSAMLSRRTEMESRVQLPQITSGMDH